MPIPYPCPLRIMVHTIIITKPSIADQIKIQRETQAAINRILDRQKGGGNVR